MAETVSPSTPPQTVPAGSLRERRRARTRDHIEGVALGLFLEYGYDETTVEEIAEAALISPRTFFRYFASKEDVLLARGRDELRIAARSLAGRPADEPALDSLRGLVDGLARLHGSDRDRQLAWIRLVTTTPQLAAAFLEMLRESERMLREFVAGRLGLAATDRLPRLVAAAFGTAFRVACETWQEGDGAEDMGALVLANLDQLVAPLLAGSRPRPRGRAPGGEERRPL